MTFYSGGEWRITGRSQEQEKVNRAISQFDSRMQVRQQDFMTEVSWVTELKLRSNEVVRLNDVMSLSSGWKDVRTDVRTDARTDMATVAFCEITFFNSLALIKPEKTQRKTLKVISCHRLVQSRLWWTKQRNSDLKRPLYRWFYPKW